ncbi:MAG: S8 family serine peptidase [Deltaproteobacteria bacterium]|nr:S8 family serine peptidase [Deltaproteobacteria bacterium]
MSPLATHITKHTWASNTRRLSASAGAVLLALLALLSARVAPADDAAPVTGRAAHGARLLVQTKGGVASAEVRALLGQHKAARVRRIRAIRLHVVTVQADQLEAVEAALRADPRVRFVERDQAIPPAMLSADPYMADAYHLARIECPAAWDVSTGSASAPIAILDSGVDASHPDLAAKVMAGFNVFDNTGDTRDLSGHGTMVAGVAAAASDNEMGIAGVAWSNPIMPVRVTDTDGFAYTSTLAAGLVWAADHGARVANISFAIFGGQSLEAAAQYFASQGGVTFAAAGNDGFAHRDQANPWIISVAATDRNNQRATFSSTGPYVDLAAPGVAIPTTARDGGYAKASGTSFSSPIAAGVAGLLLGANPDLTPAQIGDLLAANARDLGAAGYDENYGWGLVNAADAVAAARVTLTGPDTTPPAVTIAAPGAGEAVRGIVTVSVAATDNGPMKRVVLHVDGRPRGSDVTAPYTFAWDTRTLAAGSYSLSAIAYDASGNWTVSPAVMITVIESLPAARRNVRAKSRRLSQGHAGQS